MVPRMDFYREVGWLLWPGELVHYLSSRPSMPPPPAGGRNYIEDAGSVLKALTFSLYNEAEY